MVSLALLLALTGVSLATPVTQNVATRHGLLEGRSSDRDAWVTRNGSELQLSGARWTASGPNVYWLGVDENVTPPAGEPYDPATKSSYPTKGRITEVMNIVNTLGGTAIRAHTLGANVGNPLSLAPARGEINQAAFATIDWTVYQARQHGIRLLVPLTDNYDYYHGGKFTFLRWHGVNISSSSPIDPQVQKFYTDPEIVDDFKNFITKLLTHKNPYTNLTYASDPTIFAYETGNELGGPTFKDKAVPTSWTQEIASLIKTLAPNTLVVDGTYGINEKALNITEVDIYSNHYYPPDVDQLESDIELVGAANKVYFAGEYAWTDPKLDSWFTAIEKKISEPNSVIAGDYFWSLFGHNVPNCDTFVRHQDGFSLYYDDPENLANVTAIIGRIRQHLFRMRGEEVDTSLPSAPCPGPDSNATARRAFL